MVHAKKSTGVKSKKPIRQILLMSSSNGIYGSPYLIQFLIENRIKKILFIPYAAVHHDYQTYKIAQVLKQFGFQVEGIQYKSDPVEAIESAEVIYVGGGNTFLLLKTLYDKGLMEPIYKRVIKDGIPYIGTSAGANVATVSIHTTNDMPIVFPHTFDGLRFVPFNINPHFSDTTVRCDRIQDYCELNDSVTVGLREGSCFLIYGNRIKLIGLHKCKIFRKGEEPREYSANQDLKFLLRDSEILYPVTKPVKEEEPKPKRRPRSNKVFEMYGQILRHVKR